MTRHPTNVSKLQQFCKENLSDIPPQCCASLIHICSTEITVVKGSLTLSVFNLIIFYESINVNYILTHVMAN